VPIYLHNHFGQGKHAMIVSIKSGEYRSAEKDFRSEGPITGNESRLREVKDVTFPELLTPIDDVPPATMITRVIRDDNKAIIRGCTIDNGIVKKVTVNGRSVQSTGENFAEWEVVLESIPKGDLTLIAIAEDVSGNVEKTPMKLIAK